MLGEKHATERLWGPQFASNLSFIIVMTVSSFFPSLEWKLSREFLWNLALYLSKRITS